MIRWMAEHKVAANLLMIIIIFTGVMGARNIKQEVFAEMELYFIVFFNFQKILSKEKKFIIL